MSDRTTAKARIITREILRNWHPYHSLQENHRWLEEWPEGANIEYETEVAFEAASRLRRVDGNGFDHAPHGLADRINARGTRWDVVPPWRDCVVEFKTATLNGYQVDVDGMGSSKIGALALVLFDARRGRLAYFHVPPHAVGLLPRRRDKPNAIRCRFSASDLTHGELEAYRVDDFHDLAELAGDMARENWEYLLKVEEQRRARVVGS